MAEFSFNFNIFLGLILFLQVEFFFFLTYNNFVAMNKLLTIQKSEKSNQFGIFFNANTIFYILFFSLIFFKGFVPFNLMWVLYTCFIVFLVDKILKHFMNTCKSATNFLPSFLPLVVGFFVFLFNTQSLLVFFFLIELYGVLYYFIFLSTYTFSNQTILKYKNGIIILLWNNFLTTFFIGLGLFFLIKTYGTTDFIELSLISTYTPYIYIYILGICWKLGLPLFHFLKLEVYKILLRENVFLFSILTTLVNLIILYFLFTQPIVIMTIYTHNWLTISFMFLISLIVVNLKLYNILTYFALSGVLTSATLLVVFLV